MTIIGKDGSPRPANICGNDNHNGTSNDGYRNRTATKSHNKRDKNTSIASNSGTRNDNGPHLRRDVAERKVGHHPRLAVERVLQSQGLERAGGKQRKRRRKQSQHNTSFETRRAAWRASKRPGACATFRGPVGLAFISAAESPPPQWRNFVREGERFGRDLYRCARLKDSCIEHAKTASDGY